jgi:hypothetical protein
MMVDDEEEEEEEEEGPQKILRFASVDFYHRSKVENNSWGLNLTPPYFSNIALYITMV